MKVLFRPEEKIPPVLRGIINQVNQIPEVYSNRLVFEDSWQHHGARIKATLPYVTVEQKGASIYSGTLSPGCRLCREGNWDCIFATMKCNLNCSFCSSPQKFGKNEFVSALGKNFEELEENYHRAGIKGISFSGGEPFLVIDEVVSLLVRLKNAFPNNYYWMYTNGTMVDPDGLRALSDAGINEIRFNAAATDYDDVSVLKKMKKAASIVETVTVEIPCIPKDKRKIVACLKHWSDAGVKHLNLHELIREPGSNSETLNGTFNRLILEDGHQTDISVDSRGGIEDIFRRVKLEGIPLSVNQCSIYGKLHQVSSRRKNVGLLKKQRHERYIGDGRFESVFAFKNDTDYTWLHPNTFSKNAGTYSGYKVLKLQRLGPLSIGGKSRWLCASIIG